jgi:C4-dicarboxylate transporter
MHQVQGDGGHVSLATVASVAIIASLGLTFLLDKYKDKQDKNLREELKDRIKD